VDAAMANEAYCTSLCVHQLHIKPGIEPVFWQEEPKAAAVLLPMPRPG
jgi:hypothetical protein